MMQVTNIQPGGIPNIGELLFAVEGAAYGPDSSSSNWSSYYGYYDPCDGDYDDDDDDDDDDDGDDDGDGDGDGDDDDDDDTACEDDPECTSGDDEDDDPNDDDDDGDDGECCYYEEYSDNDCG